MRRYSLTLLYTKRNLHLPPFTQDFLWEKLSPKEFFLMSHRKEPGRTGQTVHLSAAVWIYCQETYATPLVKVLGLTT